MLNYQRVIGGINITHFRISGGPSGSPLLGRGRGRKGGLIAGHFGAIEVAQLQETCQGQGGSSQVVVKLTRWP